jgi:hypothetical protein
MPKKRPSNQRLMRLPTRRKIYTRKQPVHPKTQRWSEYLSHMHVNHVLPSDTGHGALVDDW